MKVPLIYFKKALPIIVVSMLLLLVVVPTLASHVDPVVYCDQNPADPNDPCDVDTGQAGNVVCTTGNQNNPGLGFDFGYKPQPEPPPSGTYTFPGTSFEVTISSDGTFFSWVSDIPIAAVIVKGSNASNVYFYNPSETSDEGLHSPPNPANGSLPQISHIEFCYNVQLFVTKTAETGWEREYTWTITKDVTPTEHHAFIGQEVEFDYTVTVDQTVTEEGYRIFGTISIFNPSTQSVAFTIADVLGGTLAVDVNCPALTVASGATIQCTYSVPLEGQAFDGMENVVTVTSLNPDVESGQASATVVWGDPTIIGEPAVNISDVPNYIQWDAQSWSTDADATDTYTNLYTCPVNRDLYTDGVFTVQIENTATIIETEQSDTETVTVNCYIPSVEKTAEGSFDETHEWEVIKTVDPETQSAFAGETVTFDWTITVNETGVTTSNYSVAGVITVTNPNPEAELVLAITDTLSGGLSGSSSVDLTASETCNLVNNGGLRWHIAAGEIGSCAYVSVETWSSLEDAPTTNTVQVTIHQPGNDQTFQDTADVTWTSNVINSTPTLDDVQFPYDDEAVSDGWTTTYEDSYTCSSDVQDYVEGEDLDNQVENTAELYGDTDLLDSSTATTEIDCYMPAIEKTADATYDVENDWTITKSVAPESHSGFEGDSFESEYTVAVAATQTFSDVLVTGTITVTNPNPDSELVVALTDTLNDGTVPTIDDTTCNFDGTNLTVAADGSEVCEYSVSFDSPSEEITSNTASFTLNEIVYEATVDVAFGDPENILGDPLDITVDDTNVDGSPDWSTSEDAEWTYSSELVCPVDDGQYVDGVYEFTVDNTATIVETDESADASVTVTCYQLLVEKTAETSETQDYDWTIDKVYCPDDDHGGKDRHRDDRRGGYDRHDRDNHRYKVPSGYYGGRRGGGHGGPDDDCPDGRDDDNCDYRHSASINRGSRYGGWGGYDDCYDRDDDDCDYRHSANVNRGSRYGGGHDDDDCRDNDDDTIEFPAGQQHGVQLQFAVTVDVTSSGGGTSSVNGTITVTNPNPNADAVINSVNDVISPDIVPTVNCGVTFPYTLVNGQPLVCTYSSDLPDTQTRTNTATVVRQVFYYPVDGEPEMLGTDEVSATAEVIFNGNGGGGADATATITDSSLPGQVFVVNANEAPRTFVYTVTLYPGDFECGDQTFTNTATLTESDSQRQVSDSVTLEVHKDCVEPVGQLTDGDDDCPCRDFAFPEPGSADNLRMTIDRRGTTDPRAFFYYALVNVTPDGNGMVSITIEQDNGDNPLIEAVRGRLFTTDCQNVSRRNNVTITVNNDGTITFTFPASYADENGQVILQGKFRTPARAYDRSQQYEYTFSADGQAADTLVIRRRR